MKRVVVSLLFINFCIFANAKTSSVSVKKESVPASFKVTGKSFYIDHRDLEKMLSKNGSLSILKQLRKSLSDLGYKEVKVKKNAHLTVYLVSDIGVSSVRFDKLGSLFNGKTTTRIFNRTKVIKNGKVIEDSLTNTKQAYVRIVNSVQHYGKRPKKMSRLEIYSPEDTWVSYESVALKKFKENIKTLYPKAPKSNLKMSGAPGCLPLFGYRCDFTGRVTDIVAGLTAEKVGLKVGDILLGIDSTPVCRGGKIDEDVYNNLLSVPLKYKRKNKIYRSNIKPTISCL